ncbi:hypothetical protein GWK91_12915 [Virgibacillus sp. MSP4-1]|uniref:hypothetical protein n=1 Tax=Virgibacillus sp. MSP4-1 TaxID=2700081 RepID=UPI0003A46B13|nr:hypothetical protein [Virgibacillus sp. MSP4-1]QHS23791.1 hypothetical protein GWK91_12915 [Virgibacillus sp. MSP4-1]
MEVSLYGVRSYFVKPEQKNLNKGHTKDIHTDEELKNIEQKLDRIIELLEQKGFK